MSSLPLEISKRLVNKEVQTTTSLQVGLFNFENDQIKLNQEVPYKFQYSKENVECLVSAVQGDDETIRNKGRVLNPNIRRFHQLIKSLKNQIDQNSHNLTRKQTQELTERMIRELARAIDPASRHSKPSNLFSHQKFEQPIKVGKAIIYQDDGLTQTEYEAIYTYQQRLYLINDSSSIRFDHVPANSLVTGEEIMLTSRKKDNIGYVKFFDGENEDDSTSFDDDRNSSNDSYDSNDYSHSKSSIGLKSGQPNISVIEPITDDDRDLYLIHSLGSTNGKMNLRSLVNPYDFSFIDVILSIPKLTQQEANGLLTFLYKSNYLSAFVRSKLCQFLYERSIDPKSDTKPEVKSDTRGCPWPELLGRFLTLLQHSWFIESAQKMANLELPQVVKSLSDLSPQAILLLDIIMCEFEGLESCGDECEFLWEFLCRSVFTNACLGRDNESIARRRKLEALLRGTIEKPENSRTRLVTRKTISKLHDLAQNWRPATTRFSQSDFLHKFIVNHADEILVVLKNIPRTSEEASPLFYPIALEIHDALLHINEFHAMDIISEESGIISEVSIRQTESDISYSRSRSSKSTSKASRVSSEASSRSSRTQNSSRSPSRSSKAGSRTASKAAPSKSSTRSNAKSRSGNSSRRDEEDSIRSGKGRTSTRKEEPEFLSENSDTASYTGEELTVSSGMSKSKSGSKYSVASKSRNSEKSVNSYSRSRNSAPRSKSNTRSNASSGRKAPVSPKSEYSYRDEEDYSIDSLDIRH
ncbi:hypothetical protein TRFO_09040 [Tritrichomonas foetus]|uniref:Uncharacterized protein n=1 Tax=Tritrichomonas foetus TaxID=1144522 RepID=A0A1J4JKS1_9EUKA|nr:hypothetical protein TRFO_09040 [Tritrichomonas foetus]|eukprot:OHS98179.1 hypothetical protein TRFO_09040 [Tritrichomonas foetus]